MYKVVICLHVLTLFFRFRVLLLACKELVYFSNKESPMSTFRTIYEWYLVDTHVMPKWYLGGDDCYVVNLSRLLVSELFHVVIICTSCAVWGHYIRASLRVALQAFNFKGAWSVIVLLKLPGLVNAPTSNLYAQSILEHLHEKARQAGSRKALAKLTMHTRPRVNGRCPMSNILFHPSTMYAAHNVHYPFQRYHQQISFFNLTYQIQKMHASLILLQ